MVGMSEICLFLVLSRETGFSMSSLASVSRNGGRVHTPAYVSVGKGMDSLSQIHTHPLYPK